MFIAFDGGEGCGKTTQIRLLKERWPALFPDREVIFTHEPGGSPTATLIRRLILSEDLVAANGRTMFGLFTAAREDHIQNTIAPALKEGKIVICDRFVAATYAYQVCAMNQPISEEEFWMHFTHIPFPLSRQIIIDLDPEIGRERMEQGRERLTHFDRRGLEFHNTLRDAYIRWVSLQPNSAFLIDGRGSEEAIHRHIVQLLQEALY